MSGNTADEFHNTVAANNEEELAKEAERLFGDSAKEFLSFPETKKAVPGQGYAPVSGIECTVKGVLGDVAKNGKKGYSYIFSPDMPGWDDPGTFHSSDLWFWFETLAKCWRPFTGRHYDLARQMCDYFCNFIRTGDPNGKDLCGLPLPRWEAWSDEKPCTMMFLKDGAAPSAEPLSPFKAFIRDRIMDRMRKIL